MYLQLAEDRTLSRRRIFKRDPNKRNPLASVTLAPGRALFLAMLNMNIDGLATKLAKQNFAALSSKWLKVGGNPSKLSKAINAGKGKRPKKVGFLNKFKGGRLAEDVTLSEDLTDAQKAKIIGLSTAAGSAIGTAIGPAVGTAAGASAGASLGGLIIAIYPTIRQAADEPAGEDPNKDPEPTPTVPEGEDVGDPNATTDDTDTGTGATFLQKYKTPLLIGGGIAALGVLYYLTKKK